jgi:hypothetical protein
MRMIAAAPLMLIPLVAAAPPQPPAETPKICDRFAPVVPAAQRRAPRAERLDRLPAADLYLAVERRIDNCRIPTIVRQDIGVRR